ncbi:MAG: CapA family protein [Candidatus Hodarchaeota archaeon]
MMIFLYRVLLRRLLGMSLPLEYVKIMYPHFRKPTREKFTGLTPAAMNSTLREDPTVKKYKILFFGDLMYMPSDQLPQPDPSIVKLFKSADLILGNLESPVIDEKKNPKSFYYVKYKIAEEYLKEFLDIYEIDPKKCIFSVANSHIGDFGVEGLKTTVKRLDNLGITSTGTKSPDGSMITKYKLGEVNIGVIAWTQFLIRNKNNFSDKAGIIRPEDVQDVDWSNLKKDEKIDFLIATPHWDYEYHHFPHPENVELAHQVIENGVDLIVGHHSHVLQTIEEVNGRFCHYSLGNIFGYDHNCWETRLGGLFEVQIGSDGQMYSYNLHPIVQPQKDQKDENYRLISLEKEEQSAQEKMRELLTVLYATS